MAGSERRGRGKRARPEDRKPHPPPSLQVLSPTAPTAPSFPPYLPHGLTASAVTAPLRGTAMSASGPMGSYQDPLRVSTEAPPGKIAIPPLRPPHAGDTSPKDRKKGRTSHACETCRRAKAGCTGGQPCLRCRNTHVPCVYGDGKRDKERKIMTKLSKETESLNQHNSNVAEALRRIVLDSSLSREGLRAAIDAVLTFTPAQTPSDKNRDLRNSVSQQSSEQDERENSGEYDVNAEVGSIGSLDAVNVDTDKDNTRATGHLGKTSAVAWAKRTTEECNRDGRLDSLQGQPVPDLASLSYFTEDADLEFVDTNSVNVFDWPEDSLSNLLLHTYLDHIHSAFPILERDKFISKYKNFDRGSSDISANDKIWLAQLNAVFAIAAVFLHLTNSIHRSHHHDHLIYCARARMLCMGEEILYEDPTVDTTCALGLLCLYYFSNSRLNRAFMICGLAIRNAVALGLHVRSQAEGLPDVDKEHRVRLWWSLYSLECSLDQFTGRPSCLSDRDISTPLPINIDESSFHPEQPLYQKMKDDNKPASGTYSRPTGCTDPATAFPQLAEPLTPSSCFVLRTELSILTHEIITNLYCAAVSREKWSEVESTIRRIDERLLRWRDGLPKEFTITTESFSNPDWTNAYTLQRVGLSMMFHSARMTLFRPCLCLFEGRIKHQSTKSKDFNLDSAGTCIGSAREIINLLSLTTSSLEKLYAITPWWDIIHHLCEALSVLILEIAFRSEHLPTQAASILTDAKQGINYLAVMANQSISARKAWEIYDSLMRLVAPRIRQSVDDMPTEAPVPPGYNWRRYHNNQLLPPHHQSHHQSHQSPHHDLQPFQTPVPLSSMPLPVTTSSMAWADPQPHYPYSTAADYPTYAQFAANPLDHAAALQRFSGLGLLHGHFDDPWQHMFDVSASVPQMGMVAPDMMGAQMGAHMGAGTEEEMMGQGGYYQAGGGYEAGSGQYHGGQGMGPQ